MSDNMCLCGKPFIGMCRIIALQQMSPSYSKKVFDTSKLTNDPKLNLQLVRDQSNYIVDEEVHGLVIKRTQHIISPLPSAPPLCDLINSDHKLLEASANIGHAISNMVSNT